MSIAHDHSDMIPRGTLIAAGVLIAFTLASVGSMRLAHIPPQASPSLTRTAEGLQPSTSRNLRFTDRADGAVVIEDVDRGAVAAVIEPGQQTGFIRGVMRGLARERRMNGFNDRPPFNLSAWPDGELSLTDSATGRSIELTAFGAANRAAFAALLPHGAAR